MKIVTSAAVVVSLLAFGCGGPEGVPNAQSPVATTQATPGAPPTTPEPPGAAPSPHGPSDTTTTTSGPAPVAPPATAGGKDQLGDLEWKRMSESILADVPKHKEKFKKLCGSNIEVEIDWASLGREKAAMETFFSNYGIERLVDSFESVCHDKLGKEAVQKKVKKIRAVNVRDASKVKVSLANGTMTAELNWSSGSAPGMNEHEIAAAITKQL